MGIESPLHLLFLGAVALIVLGPKRLPELARALGKGIREFRSAFEEAAAPQTVAAPVLEREQTTEQLDVARAAAPPGAEHAGTRQAGAQQAGAQQAVAEQAVAEQAGARQAVAEQGGPLPPERAEVGPERPS
jgi:TatA/E family protein of Tat protein translocase